jgi:signal transduction histidine kinase
MHPKQRVGVVQRWTTLQLVLSHAITSAAVVFIMLFLSMSFDEPELWLPILVGVCIFGCLMGFFLTLNIVNDLAAMELILTRLAYGLRVEQITGRFRWPLSSLLNLLNVFVQQRDTQWLREQQTSEYRDQFLQQVAKTAAQEERNRLARDLHDSIKQQIFSVVVSTAAVKARWEHDTMSARKIVDDIQRNAQEAQVEMQALLQQLRPFPLENVGLTEALRIQCQALGYRTGAQVNIEVGDLPSDERLLPGLQEMFFRVAQEGLANIARHARASQVWLRLYQHDDALLLEIEDDGQGFEPTQIGKQTVKGGMGLLNVQERVQAMKGTVTIWSEPDKGTKLTIRTQLLAIYKLQETQPQDKEIAAITSKTSTILRVGNWLAGLTMLSVILSAPSFFTAIAVLVSIPVLFFLYLLVRNARTHLAILPGSKKYFLLTTVNGYRLLTNAFLLYSIAMYYIPFFLTDLVSTFNLSIYVFVITIYQGQAVLFFLCPLIFLAFSLLLLLRFLFTARAYRQTLSSAELKALTRKQQRQLGWNFLACILITVITITYSLFIYPLPSYIETLKSLTKSIFPPSMYISYVETFNSLTNDASYPRIFLVLAWFVLIIIHGLQLWPWRRFSFRKADS